MIRGILGRQILELRWQHRLSASKLSAVTGISIQQLNAIEYGRADADMLTLNDLCCAFGITLEELFNMVESHQHDHQSQVLDFDKAPAPKCLQEYEYARQWYEMRTMQFQWLRRKRELERKKRAAALSQLRELRGDLKRQLGRSAL